MSVARSTDAPRGLAATFDFLAQAENEAAVAVLIDALDASDQEIQDMAVAALLDRRSMAGHREIVARLHRVSMRQRAMIRERSERLTHALRAAILGTDTQAATNACRATLEFHEFDLIPALITVVEDPSTAQRQLASETLLALVEDLVDGSSTGGDARRRRDPAALRRHVVAALEGSVRRFAGHRRHDLIEAFLMLVPRDNTLLVETLADPRHAAYLAVVDHLTHSARPTIARLVLSFLDDPWAPSATMAVLAHRGDVDTIEQLLNRIGHEPSEAVKVNLKKIETIAWLKSCAELIEWLDEPLQPMLVQLVMSTNIRRLSVFETLNLLLTSGKPAGRRAAIAALVQFDGIEAGSLVLRALEDDDAKVQATALAQLRRRAVPGAMTALVDRLDSPFHVVRQAARENLSEFTLPRFLASFDMLDDAVRHSTADLVKKVDRALLPKLAEELHSQSRKQRLRALDAAAVLGVAPHLEGVIARMLDDEDHMVRAAAAQSLALCASSSSRAALEHAAASDSSMAVREAAKKSLGEMRAALAAAATPHGWSTSEAFHDVG